MRIFFLFLLFGVPLLVFPFAGFSFETPKVFAIEVGIEILVLLYLNTHGFVFPKNRLLISSVSVLFVVSFFHLLFSPSQQVLFGNMFRLQGILLLWHLWLFALIAPRFPKESALWALGSQVLLVASSVFFGFNQTGRVLGTLGEPNALAATVVLLFPFVLTANKRFLSIISVILVVFVLFLTQSRSAMVATTLIFFLWGSVRLLHISLKKAVVFGVVLLLLSLIFPFVENKGIYENRAEIWHTAIRAGFDSPLFGHGFGTIAQALQQSALQLSNTVRYQVVDSSHNLLLDYWVQGGILGVLVVLVLIAGALWRCIQQKALLESMLLLGSVCVIFFNPVSVWTLFLFWWLIGQGMEKG